MQIRLQVIGVLRSTGASQMGITHHEVRRHPRWREELQTPLATSRVQRMPGSRLLGVVGVLIVLTALAVLILKA